MKKTPEVPNKGRRHFLQQSAKAAIAFSIIPRFVMGGRKYVAPSDQLPLGFIGTGKQSRGLVQNFASRARIVAASDVDSQKLALFKEVAAKALQKNNLPASDIATHPDFRELLNRKDIDGVVIATPDHWHAVMTVMAANAGKHVYCEKPLAHSVEEGRAMVNAVVRNKIIFQTGSMQRSNKNFRQACELVRNGHVGEIKEVLVNVGKAAVPCDLPEQPTPQVLKWDEWVGPAKFHAFNAELSPPVEKDIFPNWRTYREYGGGLLSDWGAHMFDIAQWALGKDRTGPLKFLPPDGRDIKVLTMIYDNGIVMKHEDFGRGNAVRFIGTKGSLDISRSFLDSKPAEIATTLLKPDEVQLYKSDDHYNDWLNGIKEGRQPICDVETGHRTSSLCCVANIAYWLGRPLEWDPEKEQFRNDKEANTYVKASIRQPWKLV